MSLPRRSSAGCHAQAEGAGMLCLGVLNVAAWCLGPAEAGVATGFARWVTFKDRSVPHSSLRDYGSPACFRDIVGGFDAAPR